MSATNLPDIHDDDAASHIATCCAVGFAAQPQDAHAATLEALEASSIGPYVTIIINAIKSGIRNLPALLAFLTAQGIVLPPWVSILAALILQLMPAA